MYWSAKLKRILGLEVEATLPKEYGRPQADPKIKTILSKNPAIHGDESIIDQMLSCGEVVFFRRGERLIRESAQDNDVFFLLSGDVDIVFASQRATIREAPNQVGEMAAIDLGRPRSANVVARADEVAALKVPGTQFNKIWSSTPRFQERMQLEMTARHRERIVASHVAKQNNSFIWFATSLGVAIFTMLISWLITALDDWTLSARVTSTGGAGLLMFIVTLLHNPAYFWRRCFGLVLIATIGTFALDQFVELEASQGFGSLAIKIGPGGADKSSAKPIVQAIAFLGALALCALMDYVTTKD